MSNLATLLLSEAQLQKYQSMLAAKGLDAPVRQQVSRRTNGQSVPLSSFQEPLWFIDGYMGGDVAHNVVYPMGLPEGPIDQEALRKSITRMLERHEVLRSTFTLQGDTPVQTVQPVRSAIIDVVDLTDLPDDRKEEAGWALVDKEAQRVFDLKTGPLLTFTLLHVAAGKSVLIVSLHHIVCDTWSVSIIDREIRTHYDDIVNGKPWTLPDMKIQFSDYAVWQREQSANGSYAKDIAFWVEKLSDAPVLRLPTDRPIPQHRSYPAANSLVFINPELLRRVRRFADSHGVTLYMVLFSAFNAMLARHTGDDDIVVGTPHANRELGEMADVIGFTINSLVMRTDLSANPTFAQLVQRVRRSALEAYEHHQAPFQSVVEALKAKNKGHVLSRHSLFRAFFSLQNIQWSDLGLPQINTGELHGKPRFTVPHPTTKYDIYMYLRERDGKVLGGLEYDRELFDQDRIERMISHFIALLDSGVSNPDTGIWLLPMVSEAERQQLVDWRESDNDLPKDADIGVEIDRVSRRYGTKIAVSSGSDALTFAELDKRSNQLAHLLLSRGVRSEQRVGVLTDRSVAMTVAVLAILKSGATCVPLDRQLSRDRISNLISAASISTVLCDVNAGDSGLLSNVELIDVATDCSGFAHTAPPTQQCSEKAAFAFFTSGSTGTPNVVVLSHAAVLAAQLPETCTHAIGPDATFLMTCPVTSARLPGELLWPLLGGAATVIAPPGAHQDPELIASLLVEKEITHFSVMPQVLKQLISGGYLARCKALRWLYCVGEFLETTLVEEFRRQSRATLCNSYAQSEACPVAFLPIDSDSPRANAHDRFEPVGRAARNTRVHILDPFMQPVPQGVTGEIYVGGAQLAREYVGGPRLTAERFVPDPFGRAGARLYRTGDFGRQDSAGNLALMGRRDHRVKIMGNRIELGEIERALMELDGIEQAVAVANVVAPNVASIWAFVKLAEGLAKREPADVRAIPISLKLQQQLQKTLPQYMVPARIVVVTQFPRGRTGKIDRQQLLDDALALPEDKAVAAAEPLSKLESALLDVWCEVLGKTPEQIGIYDSFFELGGHSLLAAKIAKRVQTRVGVKLEVRSIFEAVTIAGLSDLIEAEQAASALDEV